MNGTRSAAARTALYYALLTSISATLTACASAPRACLDLSNLPPVEEQPEPSFRDRMQDFLSGRLPAPTESLPSETRPDSNSGR